MLAAFLQPQASLPAAAIAGVGSTLHLWGPLLQAPVHSVLVVHTLHCWAQPRASAAGTALAWRSAP